MSPQASVFEYAPFTVEAGKIKEFAKALGLKDMVYFDEQEAIKKGYRGIPAPPTFSTVIDFWNDRNLYQLFANYLDINPINVLHGEQQYEYLEGIFAGDIIMAEAVVTDSFSKKGKNFYLIKTVYKNQSNKTVLISTSTIIEVVNGGG